jgi:capping protein (actin filament) muscle Z-line, alpha
MAKSVTRPEKVRIVSNFILHSPPGEFNEVFNDVRTLLQDDELLKEEGSGAAAQYNKEQFIPTKIDGSEEQVLITEHGDVGGGRFSDPRTKQSFRYDHLRKEASDLKPGKTDKAAETWRAPFETAFTTYVKNYFSKGVTSVYGSSAPDGTVTLITCTESHQFNAKNFWNGRWRSQWSVSFQPSQKSAEVSGILKVQVHYYEEGNVQLVTSKEVKETLAITSPDDTAKAFCHLVQTAETDYQTAITENYQTMSSTTFKALRRALPITKAKIDWGKIAGFGIGKELKKTA